MPNNILAATTEAASQNYMENKNYILSEIHSLYLAVATVTMEELYM